MRCPRISFSGHAWWHLLTGIGACRIITGVIRACYSIYFSCRTYSRYIYCADLTLSIENPAGYDIAYRLGVIPYLVPRPIGTSKSS
ncbi:hypothetical protein BOTBODRAFT_28869 [Botryobasidium botryosum FD-172 SS1]|uniref:Alkaline ceramidase n=1 Tax=Botryobasidium botryosum (strain FD-172 SS1) TaxID=930990 RepID=A0A067MRW9_BOTB1|nr:hypothetical protein BOTBODRAFT_28869 [Botryobasidium botryosum FD-172 SS1]